MNQCLPPDRAIAASPSSQLMSFTALLASPLRALGTSLWAAQAKRSARTPNDERMPGGHVFGQLVDQSTQPVRKSDDKKRPTSNRRPDRKDLRNSPWAATAIGRLCLRTQCHQELYDAAREYLELNRRLSAVMRLPKINTDPNCVVSRIGPGQPAETVKSWLIDIIDCDIVVMTRHPMLQDLIIYDEDLSQDHDSIVVDGLRKLAAHLRLSLSQRRLKQRQ